MAVSQVKQLKESLRRAQSACNHPKIPSITESSARLMLLHSLTIVRVCVETHSRASLFHRKNTRHLYQMAMGFQHKLNTFITL